jgi:hypothetical protein
VLRKGIRDQQEEKKEMEGETKKQETINSMCLPFHR